MGTIHIRAVVQPDGSLHIDDLPFTPGEEVEITVQTQRRPTQPAERVSLAGSVLKYIDPFAPLATTLERQPNKLGGGYMGNGERAPILEVTSAQELIIPATILAKIGILPGQKFMPLYYQGVLHIMPVVSPEETRGSMPGLDTSEPEDDEERV